jgi:hypothetical protein
MPRGSKPGERRGGRKKGSLNRVQKDTRERFRDMAKDLEPKILEMGKTGNIVAIKEIFDRAYGKPPQPLTDADGEGPPVIIITKYDGD